jgi:hypothetical protein
MAEPVRAKDVQVDKLFRARCNIPGCGWSTVIPYKTYQEANAQRLVHLNAHILGPSIR